MTVSAGWVAQIHRPAADTAAIALPRSRFERHRSWLPHRQADVRGGREHAVGTRGFFMAHPRRPPEPTGYVADRGDCLPKGQYRRAAKPVPVRDVDIECVMRTISVECGHTMLSADIQCG